MDNNISIIDSYISKIHSNLTELLAYDENGELRLIDPNENIEVSAHYGATHFAASLLLLGTEYGNEDVLERGKKLLSGILKRWSEENLLPAYHYDFNNFAFVICFDNLGEEDAALKDYIKDIILQSPDSNHDTINWLPMRAIVNERRYQWTGDVRYLKNINYCRDLINNATNEDGGIEDRLPKGVSFNLQYDISTLATLLFANSIFSNYNFNRGLNFLLKNVAPDGDINYQGRGCNQIFAWGPWIFILAVSGLDKELEKALRFLNLLVDKMLDNNSMMLNNWPGAERYLWWDYHYASVYTAHFLLWLLLAKLNHKRFNFLTADDTDTTTSTNLKCYKSQNYCISVFGGRKEYLAEHGPSISLIWIKKYGNIVKGSFGPWRGLFGNKNTFEDVVLLNYCGLIKVDKRKESGVISRIIKRFRPLGDTKVSQEKTPNFCPIRVTEENECLSITWDNDKNDCCYFNFPCLCDYLCFKLYIDGLEVSLQIVAKVRNQYDWVNIIQSKAYIGKKWMLTLFYK